jgi:uncharacterized protein (TIGR02265 family)
MGDGDRLEILRQDIDVASFVKSCPPSAATQGTFFQHVRDAVVARAGEVPEGLMKGVTERSWAPFLKYPLRDFMHLAVNAAGILHAEQPLAEGLRRMGWLAYPSFASTMAGRIVLLALGDSLEDIVRATPKAYAITLPSATVEVKKLGERRYRFEFRNAYCFVDTYHRGVLEGAVRAHGYEPRIETHYKNRSCDADFEGGW